MKSFIKVALGVAALAFVQPASAATSFNITGSTAFRGALYDTIVALMGGSPQATPPTTGTAKISTTAGVPTTLTAASGRSTVNASSTVTFVGTISGINGGNPITIYCSLSGSATGLIAIANSTGLTYASATATNTGYDQVGFSAATTTAPGAATFAMSDIYQASVTTAHVTGLSEAVVAVQPFVFMANKGSTLTNITAQNARVLLSNGVVAQSYLTGNPSDTHNVYATGRDNGSGTRVSILAETKYGLANTVNQYFATTTGSTGSGSITGPIVWPTNAGTGSIYANVDPANAGNGGYSSGGAIASLMGFTSSGSIPLYNSDLSAQLDTNNNPISDSTGLAVVGYLGAGDAKNGATNGGVYLKYDGNAFIGTADSASLASVQNGGYTLWSYEHLSYKGSAPSPTSDEGKLIAGIKANVGANLGAAGVDINSMIASRTGDGALVGP